MLDMKFLREHPQEVKENIKKKFQDHKLDLVDEVIALDKENRVLKQRGDDLRSQRNQMSRSIGALMKEGKRSEAEELKEKVSAMAAEMKQVEEQETFIVEGSSRYLLIIGCCPGAERWLTISMVLHMFG